ncbi:hypothetical protein OEJ37_12355 [Burkholderia sp. BKH01]|uniref:hypothetical protein n=1 Tax=Burkholderia sp. BKH01 TaxID=2769262 RepID=UPI0021DF4407|nr:hypothetical protein [Burkholderia sp. BKH01]MCU9954148.1 hypothetical protein [Burkholderia sp. BKH01]
MARAAGQRDGGPVAGPGQPAAQASRAGVPDWNGIAGRLRNGSMRAIFSANIAAFQRRRRFSATCVSNEIDRMFDKNRRTECDTQNPRTGKNIHYCSMY